MAEEHPLAPPGKGSEALRLFLGRFGLRAGPPGERLLAEVARAFARIPYENLTKIIKRARAGSPERARRWPLEVISQHLELGAGGTCFSLTAALLHLLRGLGFEAEPILADRHYGPDTHCALVVALAGAPQLIDPGYLIVQPIPLAGGAPVRVATGFNDLELTPQPGGERVELATLKGGRSWLRLTYKTSPVDAGEFLRAWDASFSWEMMRYPLLTRVRGNEQVYLHEQRLLVRCRAAARAIEVPPRELADRIAGEFGVHPSLARSAIDILARGERGAR